MALEYFLIAKRWKNYNFCRTFLLNQVEINKIARNFNDTRHLQTVDLTGLGILIIFFIHLKINKS